RVQAGEDPFPHGRLLAGRLFAIDHLVLADEEILGLSKLGADEACLRRRAGDEGGDLAEDAHEPFIFRAWRFHGDLPAHRNFAVWIERFERLARNRPCAGRGAAGVTGQFDRLFIIIRNWLLRLAEYLEV